MHIRDWNYHLKVAHSDKTTVICSICHTYVNIQTQNEMQDHLQRHGFSLCHCSYCSFVTNQTDKMQDHLRDEHPTRLAYSIIRVANKNATNPHQSASIVHFTNKNQYALANPPLTMIQLNFMRPGLQDISNGSDPPSDEEGTSFATITNDPHSNALQADKKRLSDEIIKKYNIKTVDTIFAAKPTSTPNAPLQVSNAKDFEFDAVIQSEIDTAAKAIVDKTGIGKDELFRCGCGELWPDYREFQAHLLKHQTDGIYTCFHCSKSYGVPVQLTNHIKTHLKHRFFCYYCDMTAATQQAMNDHFKIVHGNENTQYFPINSSNFDMDKDLFVVCPNDVHDILDFCLQLVSKNDQASTKRSYLPHEIGLLPKRQIFTEEISCGRCFYSNKVRANLVRHFTSKNGCTEQQQTPVNPVPCLNTGERHSDKMINLAASSNSGDSGPVGAIGRFVPEDQRYVCGSKSCQYQSLMEDMLQKHIVTLHKFEESFTCPHCSHNLKSAFDYTNHLQFHGAQIFKCPGCHFIHYLKQHVDKHINDSHPNSKEHAIVLMRPLKKVDAPKPAAKQTSYKWMCSICLKIFNTKALVRSHVIETHRLTHQFKCLSCPFSSDTKTAVKDHLNLAHGENDVTKIKTNFDRVESEADNTPLWRRDDPTRVS